MVPKSWGSFPLPLLRRPAGLMGIGVALLFASAAAQTAPGTSYYEFGTIVAIGRQTVDIQTFDPQRQRVVQHSFAFGKETRADVVRVGDAVEVVFLPNGTDWVLKRLIVLPSGIPMAGPPASPAGVRAGTAASVPPSAVPAATPPPSIGQQTARIAPVPQPVATATNAPPSASVPVATTAQMATAKGKKGRTKPPKPVPLPSLPTPAHPAAVATATTIAANSVPRAIPGVTAVDLRPTSETTRNLTPRTATDIAVNRPNEECNRSSTDWPAQPLRLAVLDFRYPTDREEAHDTGTTGGGSGTAVADLVFARLEQLEAGDDRYLFSRGDRRRLDRSDFAGAARLGRQLGVDAVLAGTFVPVIPPTQAADDPTPPRTYELRAGIVDTCTGQLLLQTSSVDCVGGLEPGIASGANPATCKRLSTTAAQTADPKDNAAAYKPLLDDLLFPLEHPSPTAQQSAIGKVTAVQGNELTVQLAPHTGFKAGDQVGIHASRLAKNPATYTLHHLQNEEIGRFSIRSLQGTTAQGSFTGDYPPRTGDTVEPLAN